MISLMGRLIGLKRVRVNSISIDTHSNAPAMRPMVMMGLCDHL